MPLTIHAQNYRALSSIHWTVPSGLSVVIGANGAGKSTLLFLLDLLKQVAARDGGAASAIAAYGGNRALKHFGADENVVILGADWEDTIRWRLKVVPESGGIANFPEERLDIQDNTIYWRTGGTPTFIWKDAPVRTDARSILRQLSEADLRHLFPGLPLLEALEHCRIYHDYNLWRLRQGSEDSNHFWLHRHGINAFAVLRNWRDKIAFKKRYDFVRDALSELFGFFGDLEFERGGNIIECQVRHRRFDESFPAGSVASGWLVALLHLTAVAGAESRHVVGIDEFENSLHPRAIHGLLEIIHEYADTQGISVVITSQSSQVLDWFDNHPEKVFVLDSRYLPGPRQLTMLRSEEWLAHFRLGRKFADGDFAAEPEE